MAERYPVRVLVKNLEYEKIINIRYTEDNWSTFKDVSLNYQSTNTDGSEYWYANLNLDYDRRSDFHYAVYYNVNGKTYWDNNFGINYNY